ncbi:type II toxin-antitoxin system RelE/ParE family toxin [Solwaraspora sp. WMMD1047]|uniref:type II toxin-antitoxin system RelE family toxin n=1 Tax=Solwaraspora sp. WMMD1047 TaxID=3016102 RepID=UPI002415D1EE|nr:type II toxin-antitoxin system RelE/ParE family toxin [Solwaraspora sp. WMMD1047]MDG4833665.1 type II toxin-antitoxin system RelE/ParE family toxin [Solwaraspora sp. WMMD1047]
MNRPPEEQNPAGESNWPEHYTVILAPGARRALTDGLPSGAAFAGWEFINGPLRRKPHRVGARLNAPFDGLWHARRGEYRVRYHIDEKRREIHVLDVAHRRDTYRR